MSCFLGFWEFARSSRMVQIKIWKPTGWVSTIKVRLSDVQIKLNGCIYFTKATNSLRRFVHSLPWPSTIVKYTRKMRSSTLPKTEGKVWAHLDWVSSINQSFVLTRFVEELRTRYEQIRNTNKQKTQLIKYIKASNKHIERKKPYPKLKNSCKIAKNVTRRP